MADVVGERRSRRGRPSVRSTATFEVAATIARQIPTLDIPHEAALESIEANANTV